MLPADEIIRRVHERAGIPLHWSGGYALEPSTAASLLLGADESMERLVGFGSRGAALMADDGIWRSFDARRGVGVFRDLLDAARTSARADAKAAMLNLDFAFWRELALESEFGVGWKDNPAALKVADDKILRVRQAYLTLALTPFAGVSDASRVLSAMQTVHMALTGFASFNALSGGDGMVERLVEIPKAVEREFNRRDEMRMLGGDDDCVIPTVGGGEGVFGWNVRERRPVGRAAMIGARLLDLEWRIPAPALDANGGMSDLAVESRGAAAARRFIAHIGEGVFERMSLALLGTSKSLDIVICETADVGKTLIAESISAAFPGAVKYMSNPRNLKSGNDRFSQATAPLASHIWEFIDEADKLEGGKIGMMLASELTSETLTVELKGKDPVTMTRTAQAILIAGGDPPLDGESQGLESRIRWVAELTATKAFPKGDAYLLKNDADAAAYVRAWMLDAASRIWGACVSDWDRQEYSAPSDIGLIPPYTTAAAGLLARCGDLELAAVKSALVVDPEGMVTAQSLFDELGMSQQTYKKTLAKAFGEGNLRFERKRIERGKNPQAVVFGVRHSAPPPAVADNSAPADDAGAGG